MSNPRTAIVTRIVKTGIILNVLEAYEKARPVELACSLARLQESAAPSTAPGAFHDAGKMAIGAAAGALGGFKAGLAVAGVQAANDTWAAITDWWNQLGQTDDLLLLDFDYLKPLSDQLPKNSNIADDVFEELRQLYGLAFLYQSQKMSRGWSNLRIYKNYTEGKIDDPKYLAAILIGRKLRAALTAASAKEYEDHMAHLKGFVQNLPKVDDVFSTQSNDKTYLSLITLVEHLQKTQFKQELKKLRKNILEQIKAAMIEVNKACDGVMKSVHENLLYVSTQVTPDLYKEYKSLEVIPAQRPKIKDLKNFDILQELFLREDLEGDVRGEHLACLLSNACDQKISADDFVIVKSKALLEKRREILKLNAILTRIKGVLDQSGDLGFSKLLDEMRFVTAALQQQYIELISLRNGFFEEFIKLESTSNHFKVKRLQHSCQSLDDGSMRSEMINLLALTENISASDMSGRVAEDVQNSIDGVKRDVEGLKGHDVPSPSPSIEESVVRMQQAEDGFEMQRIQRLESQVLSLCSELGSQLTQNEENQALIAELKASQVPASLVSTLKGKVEKLEGDNVELKEANIGLKAELTSLTSKHEAEKCKEKTDIEALRMLSSTFTHFIQQYLNQGRSSFSIWHRHGDTGKEMAKKVMRTWEFERLKMSDDFLHARPENILAEGAQRLLGFLTRLIASDEITGNFHKHSLKTYMLGYYDYLKRICDSGAAVKDACIAFYDEGPDSSSSKHQASVTKNKWDAIAEEHRNPVVSAVSSVALEASDSDKESIPPRQKRT